MPYQEHPDAKARMASAKILVNLLLRDYAGLSDSHRNECLKIGLYKVSEAEAKHKFKTRYMSVAALAVAKGEREPGGLVHEHVYQRAEMVKNLLKYKEDANMIDRILKNCFACVVTKDEDKRLRAIKKCDGWKRYRLAEIPVIDTKDDVRMLFPDE